MNGVRELLRSLETDAARQKEQKAAENCQLHQITLLQQQITRLEERRNQLKNIVSQLSSDLPPQVDPVPELMNKVGQVTSLQNLLGVTVTSVKQNSVDIELCTSYLGISYERYAIELSLTDAMSVSVVRHNLPYFVPLQKILADSNAAAEETACQHFVWTVFRYLHAFVARRQEAVLAKNSVNEGVTCDIQNSVAYDVIEVKLSKSQPEQSHRVMLHLKYTELQRCLPSHVTLSCDGQSAEADENVIESLKKKLMSIRLSAALLFIIQCLLERDS